VEPSISPQFAHVSPPILRAWCASPFAHGFLGRLGGVSAGPYATLNLGTTIGDEPAALAENWRRVRGHAAAGTTFARPVQTHGNWVHAVTAANAHERPEGDGMVTASAGVAVAVLTADCVPVLLADESRGVVGALHAGWRGTIANIARAGVVAMTRLGAAPGSIRAALGPSIGPCCFEVDRELAERFAREIAGAARHARPGRPGKAYLDLRAIVRDQLIAAGLNAGMIQSVGPCTGCESASFFSRRAAGGALTGLQMSFIAMPAAQAAS
jgi:purine-nucleoside/S-methyl-5'-thioadenosine phosphorylase / adenosine deaminase